MAVRSTMLALIQRVRQLINDPSSASQTFDDQTIQDALDDSRVDVINGQLEARPTFSGTSIQYLDYWYDYGGLEDGTIFKQYLTVAVTPSVLEPIAGHWKFATNVYPPVYITGSVHDLYHASADLLERLQAKWMLQFNFTSDSQSFQRNQAFANIASLVKQYRMKQRARSISMIRADVNHSGNIGDPLAPTALDYMSSGNGN